MNQPLALRLRQLPEPIAEANLIPLFGNAPPFDWHKLSSILADRFEIKDFSVHPSTQSWASFEEIKEQLETNYFSTSIFLHPLHPPFYFAISKADKNKLTAAMMHGKAKAQISEPLKEGFCRFLVLEALAASSSIDPISKLTPSLGEKIKMPDEAAFCIDVEIAFGTTSCWSKLIIPSAFQKAWVEHFSMQKPKYYPSDLAKSTELILDCQCGSVLLSQFEWESLEPGDFVLLDKGNYDPISKSSLVELKIKNMPLFQAKISENQLDLLHYATIHEETMQYESKEESPVFPVEEKSLSMKELPMQVSVELARLRISLDQLMHLTPGNTLTLPVHPDLGVVLTVNGTKVGRAELLYLGESLGIRILELG
ncbi:MAG TPA: type III secretion system cytoplasmic ring protein SctQ [Chlamydiales bacterium]|nr:type III secretion system cytoplasmic ring protein SctQ [Chlamydiales bacterium]